ncbi:MAG: hypothetical protein EKK40_16095 [Bradyrhizobiaceae bacterium]|nr:MAG: hypothetical protein EKK40_16095 [Bradyrhizobiaceae bacterium]
MIGIGQARAVARARRLMLIAACSLALGACAFRVDEWGDRSEGQQSFPASYRTELLAFLRTYLNDPTGIKEAAIAEPVMRTVGGRLRYVTCVRYSARDNGSAYSPARERAVLYVDGRLDRLIEEGAEICAGANYGPFPELEKLTR